MNWLILAIAPGVAISAYIIFKDQYNREPRRYLIISFLLGMLSVLPALGLEISASQITSNFPAFFKTTAGIAINAYFFVALPEEIWKFLMLLWYAYRKKEFDEPFDGIVYAVMVGMGFATVENISYVSQYGLMTGIMRLFLAVPAHASFAIIMGYFMGKARFSAQKQRFLLFFGVFWATVFHGSYDFFLFLQESHTTGTDNASLLLFLGAMVSLVTGIILSKKAIKEHLKLSVLQNTNEYNVEDN
jgi:RsiW-degrading membrane proteinase PrsW (M82 family)